MVVKYKANNKDTALTGKSTGNMKFRELPDGARQSDYPRKITSEFSG